MENHSVENAIISKAKNPDEYLNHDYINDLNAHKVVSATETATNNHIDANHQNDIEDRLISDDSEKDRTVVNSKIDEDELLKEDDDAGAASNSNEVNHTDEQSTTCDDSFNDGSTNKPNSTNDGADNEDEYLSAADQSEVTDSINEDSLLRDDDASSVKQNNTDEPDVNRSADDSTTLFDSQNDDVARSSPLSPSELEANADVVAESGQENVPNEVGDVIDANGSQLPSVELSVNAENSVPDADQSMEVDEPVEPSTDMECGEDIVESANATCVDAAPIQETESAEPAPSAESTAEVETNERVPSDTSDSTSSQKAGSEERTNLDELACLDDNGDKSPECISDPTTPSQEEAQSTEPASVVDDKESRNDEDAQKDSSQERNTEILHVDENDDDSEMAMETAESDPFAQEAEDTPSEKETTTADAKESPENVENSFEEDGALQDTPTKTHDVPASSSEPGNTTTIASGADKEADEDSCIIPDPMLDDAPAKKEIKVINKQFRKFDITPVRLEKLIDPAKLTAKVEPDVEKNTTTVNSRPQRRAAKKAETQIKEIVAQNEGVEPDEPDQNAVCCRCSRLRLCKFVSSVPGFACKDSCWKLIQTEKKPAPAPVRIVPAAKSQSSSSSVVQTKSAPNPPETINFLRKCSYCALHNIIEEKSLSWEAMDFCNEDCMSRYQSLHGSSCAFCKHVVQHVSMGKYAVRFGLEARQFCSGNCLEEFKKGLKSCSYCQLDITKVIHPVVASIGDKPTSLKEFCSQSCADRYERMSSNLPPPAINDSCTVCTNRKFVEVQFLTKGKTHSLCGDVCFRAFKYANGISETDQCFICRRLYPEKNPDSFFVYHEDSPYHFCSKVCMNVFILFKRKIVPCNWCKVKKYNFDMIRKAVAGGNYIMMCSLNCLTLYQVSMSASTTRKIKCDLCSNVAYAQYHLTMSDATIRNFCTYNCVMVYQAQYNKTPLSPLDPNKGKLIPVPLGGPKRTLIQPKSPLTITGNVSAQKPTVSLANGLLPTSSGSLKISGPLNSSTTSSPVITSSATVQVQTQTKYIQQIIVKPPEPKDCANKFTQCRPLMVTKGVSCRPNLSTKETQTDEHLKHPAVIPIPVPIYVPAPMHMFTTPYPVPVPFPVPIPVPIFIPTTQKTFKGLTAFMKEILDKTPANPYEADLLLMAKMVAGEEKPEEPEEVTKTDSGDDEEDTHFEDAAPDLSDGETFPDTENNVSNNFNEEVLQMALKMATEQLSNSPTVDLETELTSNTITPQTQVEENCTPAEVLEVPPERPRTRKRTQKTNSDVTPRKRGRQQQQSAVTPEAESPTAIIPPRANEISSPPLTETERPDSSMCLKYTIGIRAWKQWVIQKNEQIEQAATAANKKAKTFNTNILKLTTDELNYLLCLFVKEVRKPNGMEYAPDTIYYLCLSIQQYLFENGRIDNIFTDTFYEPFTNALDEVAKKFSEVNDATQFIVTRVEEEHLWESKQLGAHSPHVLLATLMFFNTKYFNLATLEEHMQLSFSHIMKHWKRNPNAPIGKPGSPAPNRNVVLRFYPPQAALDAPNSRKKKVYEQHENEVNPLRCPVKLYEFYLSKCPESVKQRNDVFYLQPERSCVPDSPVWYSTMPLQKDLLMKMLHRIRMVKEVNISLLAS